MFRIVVGQPANRKENQGVRPGKCPAMYCVVMVSSLLWPQEVTSAFFIYGVFIGTSAATRRNDHLQLLALTEAMSGTTRCVFEVVNRAVVMGVGLFFVVYGWQNFLTGFGSFRMPSMLPIAYLRADSAVWSIGGAVQSGTDRQRPAPRLRVPAPEWRLLSRCRTAPSV
jgi:hypothetical protein